ncbi:MAG: phytoene/squalene synthase family protein [Bacteroidales bacterium]|nr:phytoene/squalene synthase family protein [Bacteroidales bacterium]MCF8328645.1 phytoene/squalene synthase family protein [Bacteroidales bacterium]
MELYKKNALDISRITTANYSTSFSLGTRMLGNRYRPGIYAVYGFVRFADEIVDTFHGFDKEKLIKDFRQQTYDAIENKISTNPILHSFQWVVNRYQIDMELIDAFLDSMEMDLEHSVYGKDKIKTYIYGSAEVVGLMCLRVFYDGDDPGYQNLKYPARKLGEAFQKVNFLRDMKDDFYDKGRVYFPGVDFRDFNNEVKKEIEAEIQQDFNEAFQGIIKLKPSARFGVYLAYRYYLQLFKKIQHTHAENIMGKRYRVPNWMKMVLLFKSYVRNTTSLF